MKHLLLALFALVIVGCSHEQSHNELLSRSEQLVFTQPDSVVRMLSPYYNDTTMTAATGPYMVFSTRKPCTAAGSALRQTR